MCLVCLAIFTDLVSQCCLFLNVGSCFACETNKKMIVHPTYDEYLGGRDFQLDDVDSDGDFPNPLDLDYNLFLCWQGRRIYISLDGIVLTSEVLYVDFRLQEEVVMMQVCRKTSYVSRVKMMTRLLSSGLCFKRYMFILLTCCSAEEFRSRSTGMCSQFRLGTYH